MFKHSSRTVRVNSIGPDTRKEVLEEYAEQFCTIHSQQKRFFGFISGRQRAVGNPVVSLAVQGDRQTGTITYPSKDLKNGAPKAHRTWTFDDNFIGLTVLYSAPEPDIDICAVHGLNGNAFDTWAWDENMWLRDFLPLHLQFKKSRTMTFGYSSFIRDTGNLSSVHEWAHSLLGAMSSVRESPSEQDRPMIFVCHSLGGLVAREAMIQLGRNPNHFGGISLKNCGLLFLATPHSGATAADWNPYLVQLAELAGIRAVNTTRILEAFNTNSVTAKDDFKRLEPRPPCICLYETNKTRVAGRRIRIVSQDSAGLIDPAEPMENVDHKQICKFPNDSHPGYGQIGACLKRLKNDLTVANIAADAPAGRQPGHDTARPTQPMDNGAAIANDENFSRQHRPVDMGGQPSTSSNQGIRAGDGRGGGITNENGRLDIGGGYATGAVMDLRDLPKFTGAVGGGIGRGARVRT